MPSAQKYGLRIALAPSNAIEAVTYMDLSAIKEELKNARSEGRDANFDCVNALNDEKIAVIIKTEDIQITMHHKWFPPQQQRGQVEIPNLKIQ